MKKPLSAARLAHRRRHRHSRAPKTPPKIEETSIMHWIRNDSDADKLLDARTSKEEVARIYEFQRVARMGLPLSYSANAKDVSDTGG